VIAGVAVGVEEGEVGVKVGGWGVYRLSIAYTLTRRITL